MPWAGMQCDPPFLLDIRTASKMLQKISCDMEEPYPGDSDTQGDTCFEAPEVFLRWLERYSTSSKLPGSALDVSTNNCLMHTLL